jgi:septum formation topological specificity factor MinE
MITAELLYEIKKQYGSVFQTSLKKQEVLFRELTFAEFDQIAQHQSSEEFSSADVEELIIKFAVVYPESLDINQYPPGIVSSLAEEILEESGFSSAKRAKQILEQKRAKASEVRSLMKAFVLATITKYSPEDLDNMTFSRLAESVALSEKIIEIKQNINGMEPTNVTLQLIDPEEEIEKERDYANRFNSSRKDGEAVYEDPIARKLWGGQ